MGVVRRYVLGGRPRGSAAPATPAKDAAPAAAGGAAQRGGVAARIGDLLLGRGMTLGLAVGALVLGIATFTVLSDGSPFGPRRDGVVVAIALVNLSVLLLLGASLAGIVGDLAGWRATRHDNVLLPRAAPGRRQHLCCCAAGRQEINR